MPPSQYSRCLNHLPSALFLMLACIWAGCSSHSILPSTPFQLTPFPHIPQTNTPTEAATVTPTTSYTATPFPTLTYTPSLSPTSLLTNTPAFTATFTQTYSATLTRTMTKTSTVTPTKSSTMTMTQTNTATKTLTMNLLTGTPTATQTFTMTNSPTQTNTPNATKTACPSGLVMGYPLLWGSSENTAQELNLNRYLSPINSTLFTISAAYWPAVSSADFTLAVYDDDGTGSSPTTLLGKTTYPVQNFSGYSSINTFDLNPSIPVLAGHYYWIGICINSGTYLAQNNGYISPLYAHQSSVSAGALPSSFSGTVDPAGTNYALCVFVNGCPFPIATATPTFTITGTPTDTYTFTITPTPTQTLTPTQTPTGTWFTSTPSNTPTPTRTYTVTATPT